jgi:hypothetical protein
MALPQALQYMGMPPLNQDTTIAGKMFRLGSRRF